MEVQNLHAIITDGEQIALLNQNGELHLPGCGLKKSVKKKQKLFNILWKLSIISLVYLVLYPKKI